jgi:hypothetical protein
MTRRYLNLDASGDYLTSETDRYKQRIRHGLARPVVAQPYNADRGTRIEEALDKPTTYASAQIVFYVRQFIKKFYSEIKPDNFNIISSNPLRIEWNFDITKDVK